MRTQQKYFSGYTLCPACVRQCSGNVFQWQDNWTEQKDQIQSETLHTAEGRQANPAPPLFLIQMYGKGKTLSHDSVASDTGVSAVAWITKTYMPNITSPCWHKSRIYCLLKPKLSEDFLFFLKQCLLMTSTKWCWFYLMRGWTLQCCSAQEGTLGFGVLNQNHS